MKPVSPVLPGAGLVEVVYAKDQAEFLPLPAIRNPDGNILTRWKLSFWERLRVLLTGDVYLWVSTFNRKLQPVLLQVERPRVEKQ